MRHTILGAGGSIGNALTYELLKTIDPVRLVSRSNFSIPGTTSFKADITSFDETLKSVKDSDVVYLTAGLEYDYNVWAENWPKIMQNAIDACKSVGAKLIFFDNVYMYGKVIGKMTEATPYNPCSKKGEIRAQIATLLEDEIRKKNITALIARAADLYGPYANKSSMPYILVFDKFRHNKSAQWMADATKTHSFSLTTDCAKGLLLLAQKEESFNQIWHLPTYNPAPDGKTFIEMVAKEMGVAPKYTVLKKWMVKVAGFFDHTIYELNEMLYQNELDYYFDSSKFNDYFKYLPMNYIEGIHETVEFIKSKKL
jgi:nucleoside-diphosphate-sugar epimerase